MLRVKIVCTIGPASTDPEILAQMIDAGMNVARINMSHGDHEFHARNIHTIREIAQVRNRPVAILIDLQGPKLRVGKMQPGGVPLVAGEELVLTTDDIIGEPGRVPIQNKEVPASIERGRRASQTNMAGEMRERILLDDGLLELEVIDATETTVRTRVIVGGILQDRKGMNLPQTKLTVPSMTEKDRVDVDFALEQHADWVAISFVRTAADIHALRKVVQGRAPLGRAHPDYLQNRKTGGSREHRGDHPGIRWPDGGARGPWHRDQPGGGADDSEDDHRSLHRHRQTCDHGDADARFDDSQSAPDPAPRPAT